MIDKARLGWTSTPRRLRARAKKPRVSALQQVSAADVYMERHGHPCAAEWRKLRNYFDDLPADGAMFGRYIYNDGPGCSALYNPPRMLVRWRQGVVGVKGGNVGAGYMGSAWLDQLRQAAASDWSDDWRPDLFPGSFAIVTVDADLTARLVDICGVDAVDVHPAGSACDGVDGCRDVCVDPAAADAAWAVIDVLRSICRG